MTYQTSYDIGLKPFNHDRSRGKWSSPTDFIFACVGHAFKLDALYVLPTIIIQELGIYGLFVYFLTLFLCVLPIIFMQSFLGQFSSTGFISVFRIAPIFKGIGFVSLAVNLTTLTYYGIFGAIPLFYFFHTLRPTIPWSCEGAEKWIKVDEGLTSICSMNHTKVNETELETPSVAFFKLHLNPMDIYPTVHLERMFSWSLMICTFLIWGMVGAILIKPVEIIGQFIRYSCLTVIGIMSICLLRFVFLPGAFDGLDYFFQPQMLHFFDSWMTIPLMALGALGPGWGSVLTMASFNSFKTNIFTYSWIMCFAQTGLMLGMTLLSIFIASFMERDVPEHVYPVFHFAQWMESLTIPTALTFLELPHFWSLLFFTMMVLGCLNLLVVQLLSVLTSLFDEYENLRGLKREITLGTVVALAIASIYFCSNHGINLFVNLISFSIITQMVLNLLLLLVVLWMYGRERFQRDLNFMTSRTYSSWMMNIVRFVAPIFLMLSLFFGAEISEISDERSDRAVLIFVLVITVVPWCLIPGYCIYKLMQTHGVLSARFRRCARPTEWYPVDQLDKQRYDVAFTNTEISQQLTADPAEEV